MYTFLMVLFIIVCFVLSAFVLIQQGKGDFGSALGGSQILFGGSGGQSFFEKVTWVLGAIFVFGALGLAILRSHEERASVLEGFKKIAAVAPVAKPVAAAKAASQEAHVPAAAQTEEASDIQTKPENKEAAAPVAAKNDNKQV